MKRRCDESCVIVVFDEYGICRLRLEVSGATTSEYERLPEGWVFRIMGNT